MDSGTIRDLFSRDSVGIMGEPRQAKNADGNRRSGHLAETWPFLVVVTVVLLVGLASIPGGVQPSESPRSAALVVLSLVALGLYWASPLFTSDRRRSWWFVVAQMILTAGIGWLTPGHWLALALFASTMGVAAAVFSPDWKASAWAIGLCLLAMVAVLSTWGPGTFLDVLPSFGLMSGLVVVYVLLFIRQLHARQHAQSLLEDLEVAHRRLQESAEQVERLTLSEERERMGRELHDTLAQGLAGLSMQLQAIEGHLQADDAASAARVLAQARARTQTTLQEARGAIGALRSSALEGRGLAAALEREVERFQEIAGVSCRYETTGEWQEISADRSQDVLRIVQEALSNIARHAQATSVRIAVEHRDDEIRITIEDDGVGFSPQRAPRGFGLIGLQERAEHLGGELSVESTIGEGTRLGLVVGR